MTLPEYVTYTSNDIIVPVTWHDAELFAGYQGSLTNVVYSSQIDSVIEATFENFSALRTVSLPGGLSYIGKTAFQNCVSLYSINTQNVSSIGASAFAGCISLRSIDLSSLEILPSDTFNGCTLLQTITFE